VLSIYPFSSVWNSETLPVNGKAFLDFSSKLAISLLEK